MIDSHAHMSTRAGGQVEKVNIDGVILAGASVADSVENVKLAKSDPKIFAAVGIHPMEVTNLADLEKIEELIQNNKVVAVGECGLDFSGEHDIGYQTKLFEGQIKLAQKYNLPLIIHAREAVDEVIEILKKYQNLRGVFHCYAGGKKRINKILELGEWYFGIDGNITYEVGLEEVVKKIPKDRLLAETDSPELTPLPFRGQKNHPDFVEYVYKKIADIWGMSFEEVEKILDENAMKLFGI